MSQGRAFPWEGFIFFVIAAMLAGCGGGSGTTAAINSGSDRSLLSRDVPPPPPPPDPSRLNAVVKIMQVSTKRLGKVHMVLEATPAMGADINPGLETVRLIISKISNEQIYPPPFQDFMPLEGFREYAPRRRWRLNDAEKARTGIETLEINPTTGSSYEIKLVDVDTSIPDLPLERVRVDITIGSKTGSAEVDLTENPPGSGNWMN